MDRELDKVLLEEKQLEYKKVALAFLKELGLLRAWKIFLTEYNERRKFFKRPFNIENWYKVDKIDTIFGRTDFTAYLHAEYMKNYPTTITEMFRLYVKKLYGVKFPLGGPTNYDVEDYVKIDKISGRISIIL